MRRAIHSFTRRNGGSFCCLFAGFPSASAAGAVTIMEGSLPPHPHSTLLAQSARFGSSAAGGKGGIGRAAIPRQEEEEGGAGAGRTIVPPYSVACSDYDAVDVSWDYSDPRTYPRFSASRLENLLGYLSGIARKRIKRDDIDFFVATWEWAGLFIDEGKPAKFELALEGPFELLKPILELRPTKRAVTFLGQGFNGPADFASTRLVGRGAFVDCFSKFIRGALEGSLEKTTLLKLQSTRGSGKTQLVKYCLYTVATPEVCSGRVLMACCSNPRFLYPEPFRALRSASQEGPLSEDDVEAFIVSLIRAHMQQHLPKAVPPERGVDAKAAYAAWSQAVGGGGVLMAFDSASSLPTTTGIARSLGSDGSSQGNRGVLEAMAYLLPPGSGIIAIGVRRMDTDGLATYPAEGDAVALLPLPCPLLPVLSYANYLSAIRNVWWGKVDEQHGAISARVLYYMCGGVPGLLRRVRINPLRLVESSWGDLLRSRAADAALWVSGQLPERNNPQQRIMWALGALVSGTKTAVRLRDPIPRSGGLTTWREAAESLLHAEEEALQQNTAAATADQNPPVLLVLPPILMLADSVKWMFTNLRDGRRREYEPQEMQVAHTALASWPRGLDAAFLHVAASSTEEAASHISASQANSAMGRGGGGGGGRHSALLYERLVANGIVARWYLLSLMGEEEGNKSNISSSPSASAAAHPRRVPLGVVLCSDSALLAGITVDFSGGIVTTEGNCDQRRPMVASNDGDSVKAAADLGDTVSTTAGDNNTVQLCGGEECFDADGRRRRCSSSDGNHDDDASCCSCCYSMRFPAQTADGTDIVVSCHIDIYGGGRGAVAPSVPPATGSATKGSSSSSSSSSKKPRRSGKRGRSAAVGVDRPLGDAALRLFISPNGGSPSSAGTIAAGHHRDSTAGADVDGSNAEDYAADSIARIHNDCAAVNVVHIRSSAFCRHESVFLYNNNSSNAVVTASE